MFYTNRSTITKTFHGVIFRPGETKEVFGTINDPTMVRSSTQQEPPKCVRSTSSESKVEEYPVEKTTRRRTTKPVETHEQQVEPASDSDNSENTNNKEVL